ncbi:MAG: hypothetical protein ACI8UO_002087 [Verrucomicrobiales bacterium]|jgi:hypothetical protein
MPTRETQLRTLTRMLNERPGKLREILAEHRPSLLSQIERDAADPGLFAAWGHSSNIDAGAKTTVVEPDLLAELSDLAGQSFDRENNVANAGLLHTYGYLLSNVETPFGFKRARWTDGVLDRGIGFPRGFLSAKPRNGSLLSNLTKAFRGIDSGGRTGFKLTQTMPEPGVTLTTTLINFEPKPSDQKADSAGLFYTYELAGTEYFITAFPVGGWMSGKIRKSAKRPEGQIQSRYNAVIPELRGRAWQGTNELTEFS